jgi:hypothetical protein
VANILEARFWPAFRFADHSPRKSSNNGFLVVMQASHFGAAGMSQWGKGNRFLTWVQLESNLLVPAGNHLRALTLMIVYLFLVVAVQSPKVIPVYVSDHVVAQFEPLHQ